MTTQAESCPLCLAGRKHPDTPEAHARQRLLSPTGHNVWPVTRTLDDVIREQTEDYRSDLRRGEYSDDDQ